MFKTDKNRQNNAGRIADAVVVCVNIMPQIKEKTP